MKDAIIVHSDDYNGWVFDPSHPTQGRRFDNGLAAITMQLDEDNRNCDVIEPRLPTYEDLALVHTENYISSVTAGFSDEWYGKRVDLAHLAALFVGGTLTALDTLTAEETLLADDLREQAIESHQRHIEVDEPEEDNMALLMGGAESTPADVMDDLDEEKLLRALMAEQDRN